MFKKSSGMGFHQVKPGPEYHPAAKPLICGGDAGTQGQSAKIATLPSFEVSHRD